jgi:hypothetical protein
MNTIAEAFIKVKLGLDKQDLKSLTQDQLSDVGKQMDKQVMNLRRQARNYKIIGFELGKISKAMFKYIVAPGVALGAAGVMKYMQTTEKGASLLRYSMVELRWSFDQFLARVGKTIYDSGILTKVINKLKDILDNLDAKKIMQIFTVVKWGAILYIITGILNKFMLWEGAIRRVLAGLMSLGKWMLGSEIAAGVGATAVGGVAAKGAAKTGAKKLGAAGEAAIIGGTAGGTGVGLFASIKALPGAMERANRAFRIHSRNIALLSKGFEKIRTDILTNWLKGMQKITTSVIKSGGAASKEGKAFAAAGKAQETLGALSPHIFKSLENKFRPLNVIIESLGRFGVALKILVKGIGYFASGLFILDAAVHLMKGMGAKWSSAWDLITDVTSKIWLGIKLIWTIVTGIYDGLMAMFEGLGSILKNLFTLRWGQIFDDLADIGIKAWEESLSKIGVAIGNIITPLEGETAGNKLSKQRKALASDPFRFLPTGTSTTSFAGLHQAAQEMINKENEMNSRNKNTDAILANTDANKELKEAMLKDAEATRNYNAGIAPTMQYIKGTSGMNSPYINSGVQYSYGNLNSTNSSNAKTM